MSIRSFFRGLFGSSEKAVEVSTPVVVVEEKVAPKEIDAEKAKAAIEQRLKEISEENKSQEKKAEEKKVTAKEIKAKVKKVPETKVEQPAKTAKVQPKVQPAKQTEKKTENKPKASRKKTDK